MRVKSPGLAPGLANVQPPGSAKFANAPPPALTPGFTLKLNLLVL